LRPHVRDTRAKGNDQRSALDYSFHLLFSVHTPSGSRLCKVGTLEAEIGAYG
jgi:hypothetical protein